MNDCFWGLASAFIPVDRACVLVGVAESTYVSASGAKLNVCGAADAAAGATVSASTATADTTAAASVPERSRIDEVRVTPRR